MSVRAARTKLTDAIERVANVGDRIVLTRKSKGVAALVSMEDLAALQRLEDEEDIRVARKARKEKGGISLDDYRKKHGR